MKVKRVEVMDLKTKERRQLEGKELQDFLQSHGYEMELEPSRIIHTKEDRDDNTKL